MWLAFAFGSAIFAGLTSILAKCGIKKTDRGRNFSYAGFIRKKV